MNSSDPTAGIYFYDDFMLDRRLQVERTYFSPKPFSEPYYDPDSLLSYPVVEWCPEVDRYRAWYSLIYNHCVQVTMGGKFDEIPTLPDYFVMAMAESRDGVHWEAAKDCGSTDAKAAEFSQIVYSGLGEVHGSYVFRDDRDPDPARRYKCAGASIDTKHHPVSQLSANCIVAVSADGVHWDELEHGLKWGCSMSDAINCMFYNPVRDVYQIIHRAAMTDRRIHSTTSRDLIHWSDPELIVHPDPLDPACSQLYGMVVYPSRGVFIGILYIYQTDMFDDTAQRIRGLQTMELVYSYDGSHWNRTHHQIYSPVEYPAPGSGLTYVTAIKQDRDPDRLLLTCLIQNTQHGWLQKNDTTRQMGMRVDQMRMDGFVGLRSVGVGQILTKPIRLLTPQLLMNVNATVGRVTVQLTDWDEEPIPGYTFEESIPFCGDSVQQPMAWRDRDLSDLVGRIVRIEVRMETAILYAIYGNFNPHHAAVPIVSYGNPKPLFDDLSKVPDKRWWIEDPV